MYLYVGNNPLVFTDPFGLCKQTPWYYSPWVSKPMGMIGGAAGYIHDIPGRIVGDVYGADFTGSELEALSAGFYEGQRAGSEIAVNEYTFGLTDWLDVTSASEKVSEYGAAGVWSRRFAGISRDAAIAAALVGASGTNVNIEGPKGARLFQLRSVKTGKPIFRLDKAGMLRGKKIGPHYHRPPDMRLHRPQQGW